MHAQPNNLRHLGDHRVRENAMGERGHIALQREGLVAAATRLERTASALIVDTSPPRLSLAEILSPPVGRLNQNIPQQVPANSNSIAMGLCGYDYRRAVISALPRNNSPNRERLE
jgi:hypothetical protein